MGGVCDSAHKGLVGVTCVFVYVCLEYVDECEVAHASRAMDGQHRDDDTEERRSLAVSVSGKLNGYAARARVEMRDWIGGDWELGAATSFVSSYRISPKMCVCACVLI